MKEILKDKALCYDIFVDLYYDDFDSKTLDKEFEKVIRYKVKFMPYAFVEKLKEYEIER